MEEKKETAAPELPEERYIPRPAWQVWAARAGLILAVLFVLYQVLVIAGGGL